MRSLRSSLAFRTTTLTAAAWVVLAGCGDDGGTGGAGGSASTSSAGSTTAVSSSGGPASTSSSSGQASSSGQGGDGTGAAGTGGEGTGAAGAGGDGTGGVGGDGAGGDGTGGVGGDGTGGAGGDGSGGDGTGGAIACEDVEPTDIPGDACDAVAEAICTQFEQCYPFVIPLLTGTREDCVPWARAQCLQNNEQPGDPNTAADYEACAELTINAPCGCEVCGEPSPGTQASGDACIDDSQCASHVCRGARDYIECGTCWDVGALGDACQSLDVACDVGLYCDAGSGECAAKLVNGETCDDSDACLSDVCYEAECIDPLAEGEDCSGDGGDGACSLIGAGLWCDPGTQLCAPFPLGQTGDACGLLETNPLTIGYCLGNLRCSAAFPEEGTCIAKDDVGDPCTVLGGSPDESTCLPHLHCVGGNCTVPTPITCE